MTDSTGFVEAVGVLVLVGAGFGAGLVFVFVMLRRRRWDADCWALWRFWASPFEWRLWSSLTLSTKRDDWARSGG